MGRARSVSLATVQSGQILDWPAADKTALLVFTPLPVLLIALLRVEQILADARAEPYLDRTWLSRVESTLLISIGFGLVFAPLWWWIRKRAPESRAFTYAALGFWFTAFSAGGYLLGQVSTPVFGGLLAMLCAVLLFYDDRLAGHVVTYGVLSFFAPVPLVLAGMVPYGPVFRAAPFAGDDPSSTWLASTSLLALIIAVIPVALLAGVVRRWRSRDEMLLDIARLDPLTGVANRRYFFDRLEIELHRAERYASPVSLLLLDLDHFKRVNDDHGHLAGDAALVHVAEVLRETVLRRIDLIGRYGGEEFAILLPDTDLAGAQVVAERCRAAIAGHPCHVGGDSVVALSASIGVASPGAADDVDALVGRVDEALYQAKAKGRDRVIVAP